MKPRGEPINDFRAVGFRPVHAFLVNSEGESKDLPEESRAPLRSGREGFGGVQCLNGDSAFPRFQCKYNDLLIYYVKLPVDLHMF